MNQDLGFHQDIAPKTLIKARLGDLTSLEIMYKAYVRSGYALAY